MKQLTVILYNIRSTYNVGAILRTCDCLGVSEVIFTGYTPFLDKGLPHEQEKLRKITHNGTTVLNGKIATPSAFVLEFEKEQLHRIKYIEKE